jgi:hypothetical protein
VLLAKPLGEVFAHQRVGIGDGAALRRLDQSAFFEPLERDVPLVGIEMQCAQP